MTHTAINPVSAPPRRESPAANRIRATRRFLVLSGEAQDAAALSHAVARRGGRVSVQTVPLLHDALKRLHRGGFEAVLVSVDALEGNALAELERLCDFAGKAPVLLIASTHAALNPAAAVRSGAQDVLDRDELTPERLGVAIACAIERQRQVAELRDLSITDPLTGLHNRRGFRSLAEAHLRLMRRTQRQSLLLFADLDQLKEINDEYGHAAGDQALQLCAEALRRSTRDSDLLARYGGDEFVALALDVTESAGAVLLPRVASALASLTRRARLPFTLSLSVGTAAFGRGSLAFDEVLARADRELYGEKQRRHFARTLTSRQA